MRLATPLGLMIASAFLAGPGTPGAMAARMEYRTSGSLGTDRSSGASALHFEGVRDGVLETGSAFDLGRFGVEPGSSGSYGYTPFDVSFTVRSVDGVATPEDSTVAFRGWIEGTVKNGDASKVRVILAEMTPHEGSSLPPHLVPPFRTGGFSSVLALGPGGPGVLDPSGAIRLEAVVRPQLLPSPAPEPGTIAVFLGAAGLAMAHRRSRPARRD